MDHTIHMTLNKVFQICTHSHMCYIIGHSQNEKGCNNESIYFLQCAICTNITSITTLYWQNDKIFIIALVNLLIIVEDLNIKCSTHTRSHMHAHMLHLWQPITKKRRQYSSQFLICVKYTHCINGGLQTRRGYNNMLYLHTLRCDNLEVPRTKL